MKAAVVIDAWKREIFERHLREANYTWEGPHKWPGDCLVFRVNAADVEALGVVIRKASKEALMSKKH